MSISVTISGESPKDLHINLLSAAAFFAPVEAAPAVEAPKAEDKKPATGRKAKAAPVEEPKQIDIEDVTNQTAATYDDVVSELQKVNGAHGMQAVREIIQPFGAQAIKELKPEQYGAVVAAAKAKLAA